MEGDHSVVWSFWSRQNKVLKSDMTDATLILILILTLSYPCLYSFSTQHFTLTLTL